MNDAVAIGLSVYVLLAFLPFIAAMLGRGAIWKFLAFVFCILSLAGTFTILGAILAWCAAWVFAAIARGSADRFRRQRALDNKLLKAASVRNNDEEIRKNIERGRR